MNPNRTAQLFGGGVPTDADVKRLMELYPPEMLTEGRRIFCEDVARSIGLEVASSRYTTVEHAWRRRIERDFAILTVRQNRVLEILTPSESVSFVGNNISRGRRQILRNGRRAMRIDRKRLTAEEQRVQEGQLRYVAAIQGAGRIAPKRLTAPEMDLSRKS